MSISSIMTGIATLSPTYDSDVTVKKWTYDSMDVGLSEADCPVRMIGIVDDKQSAVLEVSNMGNKDRAEWQILDRLFLFPVALDLGIENYNHKILNYQEQYFQAISADKCLGSSGAKVLQVAFNGPYVRPFPDNPGSPAFWVVDALLTIQEYR